MSWYLLDNKEFPTLKSPNQNVVFIGYYILIGCFSRTFEYEFQTHTTKLYHTVIKTINQR
jgi:hypothetical protein